MFGLERGGHESQFGFHSNGLGLSVSERDRGLHHWLSWGWWLRSLMVAVAVAVAVAARVSPLATVQARLVQQRRANQFVIRFQVVRRVFGGGLPRIKAHLAKGFACFAGRFFGFG